jgi:uncharacterized membrane protein
MKRLTPSTLLLILGLLCSTQACQKPSARNYDPRKDKDLRLTVTAAEVEMDIGKSAKATITITKRDFDADVLLRFQAPPDSDLHVPQTATIKQGQNKIEIEVTAGRNAGDFDINVLAASATYSLEESAVLKVQVNAR